MKNAIETAAENLIPEANVSGPIVLKFDSEKTAGEVYEYTIDSIEKALKMIIALGKPELIREGENRLKEFAAILHNAGFKSYEKTLERATFEELNAPKNDASPKAWTIVNGERVYSEVL